MNRKQYLRCRAFFDLLLYAVGITLFAMLFNHHRTMALTILCGLILFWVYTVIRMLREPDARRFCGHFK